MLYMLLQVISDGCMILIIIFVIGIDLDDVIMLVQNCVNCVILCLLQEVQCLGVVIEKLLLDLIMVVYLILFDNCYDMLYLFNYVDQFVKDELVCINGVG